ncbi:MAG: phosphoribosylformylglycinamidine cyclo-ligase [Spirochaetales bacterium]|nr:phosphoribosylformylglycinamidine cyclo-ligase [Spirochaetales bacterium]
MGETYAKAGVDIQRGDSFARFIAGLSSPAVSGGIGGFSGGIEPDLTGMKHPVLLSTTDGVGTKILVARQLRNYSTIGIDLVAMSVNDLAVCGARPAVFLDYIACGKINEPVMKDVIAGIVRGCEEAGCVLTGGETAEMPGVYGEDDIDLAGFCSGFVDRENMLPRRKDMDEGDLLLGIPSSGIHSNGLSLARKVLTPKDTAYEELLTPTRIYVKILSALTTTGKILGAAHITGGGLEGNLSRVLPPGLKIVLNHTWEVPEIFHRIQRKGNIDHREMERVFNMGIGVALVVHSADKDDVMELAKSEGFPLQEIGELHRG